MRRRGLTGSFWPSEQQELLLRAALVDGEPGEQAWLASRPTLDIERLELGSSMLLPLVEQRLRGRGSTDELLPRMTGVYRNLWSRNQLGLSDLKELLTLLGRAHVETMLLGPAALVTRYYARLGLRALYEPAILVRPDRVDDALRALERAGWDVDSDRSGRQQRVERRQAGENRPCAVYWRFLPELDSPGDRPSVDELWAAALPKDVDGVPALTLCATDELLHTCVGGARSGNVSRVQWVADAATILEVAAPEIEWTRLVDQAARRRCALRLHDALAYLAEVLLAPVPATAIDELARIPSTPREQRAHRLAGRGPAVLGNVPAAVAAHMVTLRDESIGRTLVTLPDFLAGEWGVDGARHLPAAVARRTAGSLAAARARRVHH